MKKIILLVITAFVVTFSGCKTGGGGDPKTVLHHFFDALADKNKKKKKKYVTKDSEGMLSMIQMGMNNMKDSSNEMMLKKENVTMGEAVISGDRATVAVKDKRSGEETDFVLKKESGDWKVAFDKSTLMEMAQKKMKEHGMNGMERMNGGNLENMNMDSLQNHLKNMSPGEKERAQKMMDSASKMINEMQEKAR